MQRPTMPRHDLLPTLHHYRQHALCDDLVAGVIVAVLLIPLGAALVLFIEMGLIGGWPRRLPCCCNAPHGRMRR